MSRTPMETDAPTPLYSPMSSDPDFRELVVLFVSELPGRIELMRGCIQRCDWATLQKLAHQLKGAAGSYGFPQISTAAAELDTTLKAGSTDSAKLTLLTNTIADLCRRASDEPEPN